VTGVQTCALPICATIFAIVLFPAPAGPSIAIDILFIIKPLSKFSQNVVFYIYLQIPFF
jgi:hypothetical protein